MADMTAITIATFAIRLNMFITLLTAGIHHLQSLTAHPVETASLFGSCTVSTLLRGAKHAKRPRWEITPLAAFIRVSWWIRAYPFDQAPDQIIGGQRR
jgi:hypothetical protein